MQRTSWWVPIAGARLPASRQWKGSREGLWNICFKGMLLKKATKGWNLCSLNPDEYKPILSLLLPSSNLPILNKWISLHPHVLHCQPFRRFAKYCCVVPAHHVQSLPSPEPWIAKTLHSKIPGNQPTSTGFPLRFSFCFLHIFPISVSFPFSLKQASN